MIKLITFENFPIIEQLKLEESLLRNDERNFCLINFGTPPAIILGRANRVDEWLQAKSNVPIIQRSSGGGSVVVDEDTLFITFILNTADNKGQIELLFPSDILKWGERLYVPFFRKGFALIENDFAIHDRKCAGNALYLKNKRFLFHTSFLWDYSEELMACLKTPPKAPAYRKNREHRDFLYKLKADFPSKEHFFKSITKHIKATLPETVSSDIL